MKNSLIAIIVLFTFNLFAQVPDSLEVEFHWQLINLQDCEDTMGEGPVSDKPGVYIYPEYDEKQFDDSGDCILRTKNWKIIDWNGGLEYDYTQVGTVKDFANTNCENQIYIHYEDNITTLAPEDLLIDPDPTHNYSFSSSDPNVKFASVTSATVNSFELYVYDHTDNTVCKSDVFLTRCEDDIVLDFPETAEIEFNGEPYILLTPEMLGIVVEYPCNPFVIDIDVRHQSTNLLTFHNVGDIVPIKVHVDIENEFGYFYEIDLKVTGIKPEPIPMFIEDKTFEAGEEVELEVWSTDIAGLISWQLQLEFTDAKILDLLPSAMFDEIPFNNVTEEGVIRALWFTLDGFGLDAQSDETWFTLVIQPNFDGSTYDIFETQLDPYSQIGIEDDNFAVEYNADFVFNIAPRDILSSVELVESATIKVSPMPARDFINIDGVSAANTTTTVQIHNLDGQRLLSKNYLKHNSTITIDVSDLPSGMFFLSVQQGNSMHTQKILKI